MKIMLPEGAVVNIRLVGEELGIIVVTSHEPWSILATKLLELISEVIELYDQDDPFCAQLKQLCEIINARRGTLQ